MSESSDDESKPSEMGKVIDIRDRLPPLFFGDNPIGLKASKVLQLLLDDADLKPAEVIATLYVTSVAYQRALTKMGMTEIDMREVREEALHLSEQIQVNVEIKEPKG